MEKETNELKMILGSLPGLDCGICGFKSCEQFAMVIMKHPDEIKNCIHLDTKNIGNKLEMTEKTPESCNGCLHAEITEGSRWKDSLGRDYDFILQTFPNEPGPRETILPHNPLLIRELEIKRGDILIGRPMGMSCGCPITHCGIVVDVDYRNCILIWCVTGPLHPRSKEHKDIGYYSAQAYEGMVKENRNQLQIGMRYWFLPRLCMLQWRHSGLINFLSKTKDGFQVRIEGLMIG